MEIILFVLILAVIPGMMANKKGWSFTRMAESGWHWLFPCQDSHETFMRQSA